MIVFFEAKWLASQDLVVVVVILELLLAQTVVEWQSADFIIDYPRLILGPEIIAFQHRTNNSICSLVSCIRKRLPRNGS